MRLHIFTHVTLWWVGIIKMKCKAGWLMMSHPALHKGF